MIASSSYTVEVNPAVQEERLLSTKQEEGGPAFQGGTLPPPLELDNPWRQYPASDSDTAGPSGKSPGCFDGAGWIWIDERMKIGGEP